MSSNTDPTSKMLPNQAGVSNRSSLPRDSYFALSMRPLHMLAFLLPVILLYELGSFGLFGPVQDSLEAHQMLIRFFDLFGAAGLHLPAIALIMMLVIQHVLSKDPFGLSFKVWIKMIAESAFLTGPLIVMVMILKPIGSGELVIQSTDLVSTQSPSQLSQVMLALGAGLYEEMLFRLVLITMIHFVVSDVLGFSETVGYFIGLFVSAAAFAWHHDQIFLLDGSINFRMAFFYFVAGLYFGLLFLMRGLGIAVGVHLCYDLLVLVIIPSFESGDG
ncbi:MAG: CPBP family glutamic-type intramembrane protease [Phycisphaerales bacterium]